MNELYSSLNAGEWSPLLTCRHDLAKRKAACKSLENFIVLEQGGIRRRPGATRVASNLSGLTHRLIPFESSLLNSFVLDVRNKATDVYSSSGDLLATLDTPWTDDSVRAIQFVQLNDVMFLVHPSHPPYQITWEGGTSFSAKEFEFASMPQQELVTDNNLTVEIGLTNGQDPAVALTAQTDVFAEDLVGTTISANRKVAASTHETDYWYTEANGGFTASGLEQIVSNINEGPPVIDNLSSVSLGGGDVFRQSNGAYYTVRDHVLWVGQVHATNGNNAASYPAYFVPGIATRDASGMHYFIAGGGWRLEVTGTFYGRYQVWTAPLSALSKTNGNTAPNGAPYIPDNAPWITSAWTCVADQQSTADNTRQLDISGSVDELTAICVVLIWRTAGYQGHRTLTIDSYDTSYTFFIHSVRDARHVFGTILNPPLSNRSAYANLYSRYTSTAWSYSAMTAMSYPSAIAFFQNRLWLGGMANALQTIYASKIDDYANFTTGSNDDDALSFSILSQSRDRVCWLLAEDGVIVGMESGEWLIRGENGRSITPSAFEIRRQSGVGSAPFQPYMCPSGLVFIGSGRTKVYEYAYSYDRDRYAATSLSILAEHIPLAGIVAWAFQRLDTPVLWLVLKDGTLAGCTYNREQEVIAWHRHRFGNGWNAEAVACIHDPREAAASGYDQLFLVLNDGNERFLSRMIFNPSYSAHDDDGIAFPATATLMPCDLQASDGHTLGQKKRIAQASLRITEGTALQAGTEGTPLTPVPWSTYSQGWLRHTLVSPSQYEPCYQIQHDKSEPFALLALSILWDRA